MGTIRITATDHAADTVIWPKLSPVLKAYPDLKVEVITDYSLTDIVAEKYDAGVRLGEQVSEGMIAVRVSADFRMLAVASPGYFEDRAPPRIPRISPTTTASICACPPTAGCTPGNSRRAAASCACG